MAFVCGVCWVCGRALCISISVSEGDVEMSRWCLRASLTWRRRTEKLGVHMYSITQCTTCNSACGHGEHASTRHALTSTARGGGARSKRRSTAVGTAGYNGPSVVSMSLSPPVLWPYLSHAYPPGPEQRRCKCHASRAKAYADTGGRQLG